MIVLIIRCSQGPAPRPQSSNHCSELRASVLTELSRRCVQRRTTQLYATWVAGLSRKGSAGHPGITDIILTLSALKGAFCY